VSAPEIRVVLVTAPDPHTAAGLARVLVEERLAACGNVVPGITSVFRWDGEVQEESEVLLILKTEARQLERLVSRTVELHPYDVPEVIAVPVDFGHRPYLSWVSESVSEGGA
jgi:periplasmic divalent cation tolerance protein